jgi:thiosulfate dehydrogenase [quinone] large subunit
MALHPTVPASRAVPAGRLPTDLGLCSLAVLRIALGLVFLWAFLDKTFGWHYATPSARAWVRGGSPTKGFLSAVDVGPFASLAHRLAGQAWVDWAFMLGLLGLGVALLAGVGLRLAAAGGGLLLVMMWLAEFPPAQHTSAGAPSGSSHPIIDYHVIYALGLLVVAATLAGDTWGLGRRWAARPRVQQHGWLR